MLFLAVGMNLLGRRQEIEEHCQVERWRCLLYVPRVVTMPNRATTRMCKIHLT